MIAPGDLALCVAQAADGWWWNLRDWAWRAGPRCGGVYCVAGSRPPALTLAEFPGEWYEARHFRRIAPHKADAEDAETLRLLSTSAEALL